MEVKCRYDALVPVGELVPYPRNRNRHTKDQVKRLAKLLKYQGVRAPIIVSNLSKCIMKGHGTLMAIKFNGWKEAPVVFQDFENEDVEYAFCQSDNAISAWADLDLSEINKDLENFDPSFDLEHLGIKDFQLEPSEKPGNEDSIPEKKPAKSKLGDLYILGGHRLLCGDSTNDKHIDLLFGDQRAEITFTSPPYNAAKNSSLKNKNKYQNSSDDLDADDFHKLMLSFTELALIRSDYVFVNIQSLSGNKLALIKYLYDLRKYYADTVIWDKQSAEPAMAKNVLNSRFEYVHVFSQKANRAIGTKEFRGTLENIFCFSSKKDKEFSDVHKATFPVGFAEHFIKNFSTGSVFDPFGGAGTTLIACEKLNYKSFLMELDPGYIDVILSRWSEYTGKDPIREDGKPWSEIKNKKKALLRKK